MSPLPRAPHCCRQHPQNSPLPQMGARRGRRALALRGHSAAGAGGTHCYQDNWVLSIAACCCCIPANLSPSHSTSSTSPKQGERGAQPPTNPPGQAELGKVLEILQLKQSISSVTYGVPGSPSILLTPGNCWDVGKMLIRSLSLTDSGGWGPAQAEQLAAPARAEVVTRGLGHLDGN